MSIELQSKWAKKNLYRVFTYISFLCVLESCEVLGLDCKNNVYVSVYSENIYAPDGSGDVVDVSIDSAKITGIVFNDEHRLTIRYNAMTKTVMDVFQDRFYIGPNNEIHFCEGLQEGQSCTVENSDWWFSNYDCSSKVFNFYNHNGVESFVRVEIPSYIRTEIENIDKVKSFSSTYLSKI